MCINCPTGCATCTNGTLCTSCIQGYYLNGMLCTNCMPVCKTCDDSTSCSSCNNNLIISGTVCTCPTSQVLDPSTTTCIACTAFDTNCQTCDYNPSGYNPSSPTPIVCSVAMIGYFVQGNGTTAACGSYCDYCTSNSVCTTCQSTFFNNAGTCECSPLPLFLNNNNPPFCENCDATIPGCDTCSRSTVT